MILTSRLETLLVNELRAGPPIDESWFKLHPRREILFTLTVQTGSGSHQASYSVGHQASYSVGHQASYSVGHQASYSVGL